MGRMGISMFCEGIGRGNGNAGGIYEGKTEGPLKGKGGGRGKEMTVGWAVDEKMRALYNLGGKVPQMGNDGEKNIYLFIYLNFKFLFNFVHFKNICFNSDIL